MSFSVSCTLNNDVITCTRDADKSLTRPGRKQARKHVKNGRNFNNIETRVVIKFFFFLQGKAPKEIHAILTETLACFLLAGLRTYQHPCDVYSGQQLWLGSPVSHAYIAVILERHNLLSVPFV